MAKDIHTPQERTAPPKTVKPFVDFYNKHNVIPVSQDIADLDNFVFRRNFLYSRLGAPLRQFHNRRVIEFGPGGGFNAVATSLHQPELYVFVDASQASLLELDKKKSNNQFRAKNIEIIDSNIFDYSDDRKFDFVIVEGTICGQAEPERMLRHVASFVNESGILITTAISAASVLSEVCRRLLRIKISETSNGFDSQVRFASKIFDSHLKSLGASTRPTDDWVIDMIFHDWHNGKYIFSMADSAEAIRNEFDFYQSLPCFLTDDRWYKKVTRTSQTANELLAQQYPALAGCLIDYRISLNSVLKISHQLGNLESLSKLACEVHDTIINENSYRNLDEFFRILIEIKQSLPVEFAPTITAIDDFVTSLPRFIDNSENVGFGDFKNWWGRGQQYLSFIRTA
jgi:2-polyprenyl-3-methyl-5-hydroxy-6-metoxy-1,4-benzoquinol methylase